MQPLTDLRIIKAGDGRSSDVHDTSFLFDRSFSHARRRRRQPLGVVTAALIVPLVRRPHSVS